MGEFPDLIEPEKSLGNAVRVRTRFREIVLMCVVHNIKRAVNQKTHALYGDSPEP